MNAKRCSKVIELLLQQSKQHLLTIDLSQCNLSGLVVAMRISIEEEWYSGRLFKCTPTHTNINWSTAGVIDIRD